MGKIKYFTDVNTKDAIEAQEVSGHCFPVEKVPLTLPNGKIVPDKMATINKYGGDYLGTVGSNYTVIQPETFYGLAQKFIDQTGAIITRTMTLKGGAVMGINFLMQTEEFLTGDPIEMNFMMMTAFNMQYSLLGRSLSTRLFCTNQLPFSTSLFDIKHTTYALDRLDIALKMIGYFGREQNEFYGKMRDLIGCRMTTPEQLDWFSSLFPSVKPGSKRAETLTFNRNEKFLEILSSGRGMNVPGLKGSAYHALNALTEYVNHHRSTRVAGKRNSDEVKFESVIFGSGNTLMQKGFSQLIERAKHQAHNSVYQNQGISGYLN